MGRTSLFVLSALALVSLSVRADDGLVHVDNGSTQVRIDASGVHVRGKKAKVDVKGTSSGNNTAVQQYWNGPDEDTRGGGGAIQILTDHARRTIDCKGKVLQVQANHSTIKASHCPTVQVEGSHNHVELVTDDGTVQVEGDHNHLEIRAGAAATVQVPGDHNEVRWSAKGRKPLIQTFGSYNTVVAEH